MAAVRGPVPQPRLSLRRVYGATRYQRVLMLSDIARVGFKVENFDRQNMKKLEANWFLTLHSESIPNSTV